ncbi:NAD(P)/FAD-dependent oxidoreductase [Nonomuraea rubra]|uniref:flavin-containing monooxygenase n=1 Tax=Nonomuraea rubra TaxID=46180 RepID=UPI0031E9701C
MFAPGQEIWDYLRTAAREEGLEPHLRFGADMLEARWSETDHRWTVRTPQGEFHGDVLVAATGHLTDIKLPEVPGLDTFTGELFHSARWNHDFPLDGKRIGVVGTGASAIQIVPQLAEIAERLVVFQRSAPYIQPRRDRDFSEAEKNLFRRDQRTVEEMREMLFWYNDSRFAARRLVDDFLAEAMWQALSHLEKQVPDPELRATLTPDYTIGCKRVLLSDDYYPAVQKPNVHLEAAALERVAGSTAFSASGQGFELDVLVVATGFETYDLPSSYRIFGRAGRSLADHWSNGMQAYNSIATAGFPNLFLLNGPGTSLGHNSVIYMIEAQVDHLLAALDWRSAHGGRVLEVSSEIENAFARRLDEVAAETVIIRGGCSSWYPRPPQRAGDAVLAGLRPPLPGRVRALRPGRVRRGRAGLARLTEHRTGSRLWAPPKRRSESAASDRPPAVRGAEFNGALHAPNGRLQPAALGRGGVSRRWHGADFLWGRADGPGK